MLEVNLRLLVHSPAHYRTVRTAVRQLVCSSLVRRTTLSRAVEPRTDACAPSVSWCAVVCTDIAAVRSLAATSCRSCPRWSIRYLCRLACPAFRSSVASGRRVRLRPDSVRRRAAWRTSFPVVVEERVAICVRVPAVRPPPIDAYRSSQTRLSYVENAPVQTDPFRIVHPLYQMCN